jgi:hypothetical protein
MREKRTPQTPRRGSRPLVLLAGVLLVAAAVGIGLELQHRRDDAAAGAGGSDATGSGSRSGGRPGAKVPPPWEATPDNSPPVPKGQIPAWVVKPPRPDPTLQPPPVPHPPPDPAVFQPPMHNPGGVNGDRPPRPVPGLDGK